MPVAPQLSPWPLLGIFLVLLTALLGALYILGRPRPQALTAAEARAGIHHKTIHTVVDVRTDAEWAAGHYADALHIPIQQLPRRLPQEVQDRSVALLFYCRTGHRAAIAARIAQELGYTNVSYLAEGGYEGLTPRHRYSRY